jgi:ABC-type transport system involved in cytochrome c biogenesis permease subunit
MSSFILFYEMASHIPWLNDSTLIFFTAYGNTSSFFVQKDHGVMTNGVMTKGPRINIL